MASPLVTSFFTRATVPLLAPLPDWPEPEPAAPRMFTVTKPVSGAYTVRLVGQYTTAVFFAGLP